jgi:hypothetical protein
VRRLAAASLLTALAAAGAYAPTYAQDTQYVTVRDRLMCRTQQALRDGLRALETRDKFLFSTVDGCHFSIDGVPATLIQDNISRVKIRLSADGEQADMWTVPETIKPARKPAPTD